MKTVTSIVLNNFKNDSRVLKENISLQNANYDVKVIALHDDGQKEFDEVQNIPVHRIKLKTRSWSKNKFTQFFKYLEFMYRVIKNYKSNDIMHCNDLNTLPIAFLIKIIFNKKIKIVYDAHEYETEVNGLIGIKKSIIKKIENFLIKYADQVICVSDAIAIEYYKMYKITKPFLVLNTPLYQEIEKKDKFRETLNISKEKIIFLYQGGLTSGRGIKVLLEVFKKIENKNNVIVFMGYGPLEELVIEASKKNENVYFHKAVSPGVLLNYTCSADFGISTIEDSCLSYRYCLPNKMFEYLMAELPVIVSNLPEMKKLVEHNSVGIIAEHNTVLGIEEAIKEASLLDKIELKENIRKVKKIYNWEEQEKVLIKLYGELF